MSELSTELRNDKNRRKSVVILDATFWFVCTFW